MPYVKQSNRDRIDPLLNPLVNFVCGDADEGNLDYIITRLCLAWEPKTFSDFATLIGVLDLVSDELKRRRLHPYEDAKMMQNGDIY